MADWTLRDDVVLLVRAELTRAGAQLRRDNPYQLAEMIVARVEAARVTFSRAPPEEMHSTS